MRKKSSNGNNEHRYPEPGRRKILRMTGIGLAAMPLVGAMASQARPVLTPPAAGGAMNQPVITKQRGLGSGNLRMEVSALGFGVMGMSYNRGVHPDRKAMIELLR